MTEITYSTENESGKIYWVASEQFKELIGTRYNLSDMEASQIEQLSDLSITARILLSAVAGALIQHLIDKGMDSKEIFSSGYFRVNPEAK